LFSYAALRHPEHALVIQRVLAIPPKRFDKRVVTFLTAPEVDALLAAPDQSRWEGRRDRTLMLLAIRTRLRVSELTGLNCADVTLGAGANVACEGKGRKKRAVPLTGPVEALLRERVGRPGDPLFRPALAGDSAATPSSCGSTPTPRPPRALHRARLPPRRAATTSSPRCC
jgi:integrase